MDKQLLKTQKFINGWAVTHDGSDHPVFKNARKGDVVFIYNDKTSASGRRVVFHPAMKEWYFYIKNTESNQAYCLKTNTWFKAGKNWIRIYVTNKDYKDANVLDCVTRFENAGIPTYEADVGPLKRLCLDYDVQLEDFENIRVLYFDIETDDTIGFIDVGRDRILSFAAFDQTGKQYYLTNKDEKTLLEQISELISKYDMMVGWNSWKFDMPYLRKRFKKLHIDGTYLWNILHEDMMRRVYYFYSKEPVARQEISSYSLESISQYFLKEGKVKHSEKVIELFNKQPEKLKEYNLRDAQLLYMLEKKLGTVGHTYRLFQMCQVFAQNWSMVKSIDNFILQDGNKKGIHFKTNMNSFRNEEEQEAYQDKEVEFAGALVLDPKPGYYKDVYDLDFRSLYPNIIRSFNLSPETHLPKIDRLLSEIIVTPRMMIKGEEHGGHMFSMQEGIVPSKIGILLDERNKLKKTLKDMDPDSLEYKNIFAKQWVTKDLANSFYGVLGNKYFREFSEDMAEAITVTGQYLLTWVSDYLIATGRISVYGDTDSVFAQLKEGEDVLVVLKEINIAMTEHLKQKFNVQKSTLELGFDCKFTQFIIESKKKYTGLVDGKLRSRGMELVKRDSIAIAVESQKKLLDNIFKGCKLPVIEKWIDALKNQITVGAIQPDQITFRKRINKDPKTYKSKPLHVVLAEAQGHGSGEIVQYIITDGSKKLQGVDISEFDGKFDRTYYWNQAIYPMLERILKVVFPEVDWDKYYIEIPRAVRVKKEKKTKQLEFI